MLRQMNLSIALTLASILLTSIGAGTATAQKGGADVQRLQAEIDRLRMDFNVALQEIRSLRQAGGNGQAPADQGPLYQGRSSSQWLEQLKDLDYKYRESAVTALGFFVTKKKELIPILIATMKEDDSISVRYAAEDALAQAGEEIVPTMIDLLKDKNSPNGRRGAMGVLGRFGPKSKAAVPILVEQLKEKEVDVRFHSIDALAHIGPDARAALPALVDAFQVALVEAKVAMAAEAAAVKPMPNAGVGKGKKGGGGGPGGFGPGFPGFGPGGSIKHLGNGTATSRTVAAIYAIDPNVRDVVQTKVQKMDRAGDDTYLIRYEEILTILKDRYPREKK